VHWGYFSKLSIAIIAAIKARVGAPNH
jgi:hypothetical protein